MSSVERSIGSKTARRRLFRKQLVLPAEHGSWSWLSVPYFVGVIVAGQWNLAAILVLIGGMAGFLMRQPATVWMQVRAGRGRRSDESLAARWVVGLGLISLLCLAALLALGLTELLWLSLPIALIFGFYLGVSRNRRASVRTMWMELAGAMGLAAMAPAAYIAVTGHLDGIAWTLWGLMAGQNALGVLYVRLRIADTHGRPVNRGQVFWIHALILVPVVATALLGVVPWLAVVPFVGFFLRAIWAVIRERPVVNIKRFGFSEVGVEMASGALIALGWLV
jgi:hypothetical protein